MANIDSSRRRVGAVLLVFGAEGSGKTTSLFSMARQLPAGIHGAVTPMPGSDERLLKLDYRPHDDRLVPGYQVTFRTLSATGKSDFSFLQGILGAVDGVLFVAGSARDECTANIQALENFTDMVKASGRELSEIPLVFFYNKRDLKDAATIERLESDLNPGGLAYVSGAAIRGEGVLAGLDQLTAAVAIGLRERVRSETDPNGDGPTAKTTSFGMTLSTARALYGEDDPVLEEDDRTILSMSAPSPTGPDWSVDEEDRTEVNPTWTQPSGLFAVGESELGRPDRVELPYSALNTSPTMDVVNPHKATPQASSRRGPSDSGPGFSLSALGEKPSFERVRRSELAGKEEPSGRRQETRAAAQDEPVLGRTSSPEQWEEALRPRAIRTPVPELEGYVVSRVGTPIVMSKLLLRVPLQAVHQNEVHAEDFVVDLELREGPPMRRAALRPAEGEVSPVLDDDVLWAESEKGTPWGLFFWGVVFGFALGAICVFLMNLS